MKFTTKKRHHIKQTWTCLQQYIDDNWLFQCRWSTVKIPNKRLGNMKGTKHRIFIQFYRNKATELVWRHSNNWKLKPVQRNMGGETNHKRGRGRPGKK